MTSMVATASKGVFSVNITASSFTLNFNLANSVLKQKILEYVSKKGTTNISGIASHFGESPFTIVQLVNEMKQEGLLG